MCNILHNLFGIVNFKYFLKPLNLKAVKLIKTEKSY